MATESPPKRRRKANPSPVNRLASTPGYATVGVAYESKRDLIEKVKRGLSTTTFDALQQTLDLPARDLYELVHISQRTLYRRRSEGVLQPDESERVLRLAALYEMAERVLGSRERALAWLKKPHRALGGRSPLAFSDTELGAREVEDLLGRIEHGIAF